MLPWPYIAVGLLTAQFVLFYYINDRQIRRHKNPDTPDLVQYVMTDEEYKSTNEQLVKNKTYAQKTSIIGLVIQIFMILSKIYPKIYYIAGDI
ncbi:MAG: hypothetical protein EZS28_052064, partial [Streblomastix strix]